MAENDNLVSLNWIPAHTGQLGNCIADGLAKLGAEQEDEGFEPRLPVSMCTIKTAIKSWGKKQQSDRWKAAQDYRQTREILPDINHSWSRYLLRNDRNDIRILTQLVTGHANLLYHRYIMKMEESPICNRCGEGDSQSARHILTVCPGLAGQRIAVFGKPVVPVEDIKKYSTFKVIRFAKSTGFWF